MTPLCKRSLFNVGSANLLLSRFLNDKALPGKLIVDLLYSDDVSAGFIYDCFIELALNYLPLDDVGFVVLD
jgi:hypothetical protein